MLTPTQTMRLLTIDMLRRPGVALVALTTAPHHWRVPLLLTILLCGIIAVGATQQMQGIIEAISAAQLPISPAVLPVALWLVGAMTLLAMTVGSWLAHSLLLAFLTRFGSQSLGLRAALTLMPWLWLPLLLRMVVQSGFLVFGAEIEHNGLSFLIDNYRQLNSIGLFIWDVLWQIDVFFLWHLALVWVALCRFTKLGPKRVVDVTLLYGLLAACVQAGIVN